MKTVPAREANQAFSKLLKRVENGEEVVITKRGQPVVKMVPVYQAQTEEERERAIGDLMDSLRKGFHLGGKPPYRDEIYGR
tara:strand:- start:175 stop:417 length:243 start_codon:yes stop_codon:yes gene_type:complete